MSALRPGFLVRLKCAFSALLSDESAGGNIDFLKCQIMSPKRIILLAINRIKTFLSSLTLMGHFKFKFKVT